MELRVHKAKLIGFCINCVHGHMQQFNPISFKISKRLLHHHLGRYSGET